MRWSTWLGSRSAPVILWGLTAVFSAWIVADTLWFGATSGLNRASYDSMVKARLWTRPADPRIVIVDIDEPTLARMSPEFGRWPWPRDTLATVLDHLERQGASAIVWDVLFSDPDRLHPGGDASFDAAARKSAHSHFTVVRLPATGDAASAIDAKLLPGLWARNGSGSSKVALIPPFMAGTAASRLGFNNSFPDGDGVVRRYRYAETLPDGSMIQSAALSVARALAPQQAQTILERLDSPLYPDDGLIAWRRSPAQYPRVPFWEVFREAERGAATPSWAGKIVLVGSTAPSLHDYHPSSIAVHHPGVAMLANAIDNALHADQVAELPRPWLGAFAFAMCAAIALWAHFRSVASLEPLLFLLPAGLLAVSFLSLHGAPIFLELQLPAALALTFLAILRAWVILRREHWCSPPDSVVSLAVWPLARASAWVDSALDRLIDAVERHAPSCRIVVPDATVRWPAGLRWPELARYAAIVGPASALEAAHPALQTRLRRLAAVVQDPVAVPHGAGREGVAQLCLRLWAQLPASKNKELPEAPR